MLEVKNISAFYSHVQALKDVTLRVKEGEIVAVIGSNGAGKSTLLKCIAGIVTNKRGEIALNGSAIGSFPPEKIVSAGITLVPEGRQIFSSLTVLENLELGAYLLLRRKDKRKVSENLEFVFDLFPQLEARQRQVASTLSGGEQQMLAIGRALMASPKILMLDEPSMGLAPMVIRSIFSVLRDLNKAGLTMLLVEQDAKIALSIAHRGYVFQTGKIVLEDSGQRLSENPLVKEIYFGKQMQ
ncbi:MAG: ABC transporter ATP-binding protein [Actinomycetota bacterium]